MSEESPNPSNNEDPPRDPFIYFFPTFGSIPPGSPSFPFAVPFFDISALPVLQVEVSEAEDILTWDDHRDPPPDAGEQDPDQPASPPPESPEA